MEALKIALDTIIVGALALPWLVLAIALFFPGEIRIAHFMSVAKDEIHSAAGGVVLFALAYFLGAGVSRVAEDFFRDDDLRLFPVQTAIRRTVYCGSSERYFVYGAYFSADREEPIDPPLLAKLCPDKTDEGSAERITRQAFLQHESTLLLEGEDKMLRLRQLHEQVVVLRGAALNGLITSALCLFYWCATHRPKQRIFFAVGLLVAAGITAGRFKDVAHHFKNIADPPLTEIALILLAAAGFYLLWRGLQGVQRRAYGGALGVSLLVAVMAYLGWWSTEVQYDQQLIYSFFAHQRRGNPQFAGAGGNSGSVPRDGVAVAAEGIASRGGTENDRGHLGGREPDGAGDPRRDRTEGLPGPPADE